MKGTLRTIQGYLGEIPVSEISEEFDLIRLHPRMGWELLNKRESTRPYAEAALYHHLWYDEKGGYPREYTFKGNDNAILYQIITCADCPDLVKLFDSENLQEKVRSLITKKAADSLRSQVKK